MWHSAEFKSIRMRAGFLKPRAWLDAWVVFANRQNLPCCVGGELKHWGWFRDRVYGVSILDDVDTIHVLNAAARSINDESGDPAAWVECSHWYDLAEQDDSYLSQLKVSLARYFGGADGEEGEEQEEEFSL